MPDTVNDLDDLCWHGARHHDVSGSYGLLMEKKETEKCHHFHLYDKYDLAQERRLGSLSIEKLKRKPDNWGTVWQCSDQDQLHILCNVKPRAKCGRGF